MLKLFGNSGPQPARPSSHAGKTFRVGNYKLVVEDLLAEGGFGVVYIVRTPQGDRYALKRSAVNNETDLHLFRQEIAITKIISDCKHSVKYVDSAITALSEDVYEVLILLHLYPGKVIDVLNQRLHRGGLKEQEALKIFTDVCEAVARLHHRTKPIIHRDIKVENILFDRDGDFVLCDYGSCSIETIDPPKMGVAKCEEQVERFTTLAYRPPEMVDLYSGKLITTKSDIWALGCLLFKLCFFTTPFGEQRLAILSGSFTIPVDSPYSEALHSLIRYMLETDPDQRPNIFQVCEIAFKLRKLSNPVPNVYGSPPPPKTLPPAPRMAPPNSIGQVAPQVPYATPNRVSSVVTVTSQVTTTISSRDRPRPRSELSSGLASAPPPGSSSFPAQAPPPSITSVMTAKPHTPGVDQFGFVPLMTNDQSVTRDTNLSVSIPQDTSSTLAKDDICTDLFGAKPFLNNLSQVHNTPQTDVAPQMDAFGCQPFAGNSQNDIPPPQITVFENRPAEVDVFGSQPFFTSQ